LEKVRDYCASKVKLVKKYTYYPVPRNVKVSREQGARKNHGSRVMIIFVHTKKAVNLNHDHYLTPA
jgi:hypothetical protein